MSARPAPMQTPCRGVLVYCRAGFEKEAAAELDEHAAEHAMPGFVRAEPGSGYAVFEIFEAMQLAEVAACFPAAQLVFARQVLFWFARVDDLPEQDRATPIAQAALAEACRFSKLAVEHPDTDAGKPLSGFCRRFAAPFARKFENTGLIRPKKTDLPALHVFFSDARTAWLAIGLPGFVSEWPMGIVRLRLLRDAPSRSTLKLAEAFLVLLSEKEREVVLRGGLRAVDLGAAPGGWSWQLAQRGLHVTAVDNGPLADSAMATGMIEHVRADGFVWRPHRPVEWMVCDMVEQPARIATLVSDWVGSGRCKRSIFNLKLPMKRRYEEVCRCREAIGKAMSRIGPYDLRIKHLYHDREEVTAYLALRG